MSHETVQVDVNEFLDEEARVGVHDETRAVGRVARDARSGRALVLQIAPWRRRRELDPVALEVTLI